ncbi:MAG: sulfotransferase family protein [Gemmataceae bacterium]
MPISIAGMHRSGTSMIARLLRDCGLDLGPDHLLLPAAADNPEGFWELAPFVAVNGELLVYFRSGWNTPPDPPPGWEQSPELAPLVERARGLPAEVSLTEPWGWKDPRTGLLLAFWQGAFPDLRVVICVRNPLAVAQSLLERDNFSYLTGLELWLTYNRRLLDGVPRERRVVTHYESYFGDAEAELARVAGRLGLPADGDRIRAASAGVKTGLRHWRLSPADLERVGAPAAVIECYRQLCDEAGLLPADADDAPVPRAQFHGAARQSLEIANRYRRTDQIDAELAAAKIERELFRNRSEQLAESLAARDEALDTVNRRLWALQEHAAQFDGLSGTALKSARLIQRVYGILPAAARWLKHRTRPAVVSPVK